MFKIIIKLLKYFMLIHLKIFGQVKDKNINQVYKFCRYTINILFKGYYLN
jgi:hypothetical protein